MRRNLTDLEALKEIEQYIVHGILSEDASAPGSPHFVSTGSLCFVTGAMKVDGAITTAQEHRLDQRLYDWGRRNQSKVARDGSFMWPYHEKAPRLRAVRALIREEEARLRQQHENAMRGVLWLVRDV